MTTLPWRDLETTIHHDPGGRGVASFQHRGEFLDAGQLRAASESLASASSVAIVTGFCIAGADPPAAETDGPPGALMLAHVLTGLGIPVTLLSDAYGFPLLAAGCRHYRLNCPLVEIPFESDDLADPRRGSNSPADSPRTLEWVDELLSGEARDWSHLITIERAGPSHLHLAPEAANRCHNMRGVDITRYTAKAHLLLEAIAERKLPTRTIGIADGGNELGMGRVPLELLRNAIQTGPAEQIACRIATEQLILAGVSNWGGYALAAAVAALRDRSDLLAHCTVAHEQALVERLVRETGAVDGVTRQRVATVDGLPLHEYLAVWQQIRTLLGLQE